jgi:hypothetical protein
MRRPLALALILVLTGCASLPIDGPVRIGPDLAPGAGLDSFYYSPSGPVLGSSQEEILNGFISAGTGPQNDYAIAREYLSDSNRSQWNPNQAVFIQRGSPRVTISAEGQALVEIDLVAKIDADGRYESVPVGTTEILEYRFVSEQGEWRISKAPDATVLIRPVFDVIFRSFAIYFFDRQQRFLVPELRWFPSTPATGTRLVNALLRGASNWLKPAVVSAIPTGTRLSIDAVTVENNIALVDLSARALVANRADRTLMKAQLEATLSQLPNVQEVAISIERSRQEIPDSQAPLLVSDTPALVTRSDEGLAALSDAALGGLDTGKAFFDQIAASDFAISRQSGWLAALSPSGVYRTRYESIGTEVELVDSRAGLVAPAFDRQQYLWTVSRSRGSEFIATFATGERLQVSAPWAADLSVRALQISPEGSRALILVQGAERNRVLLAGVVRDRTGAPLALSEPTEIANEVFNPRAVNWIDNLAIAVLNETEEFSNVYLVTLGGLSRVIPTLPGTTAVVGISGAQNLYLLTDLGALYSFRAATWSLIDENVRSLNTVY